jgi:hypothetical protein
LEEQRLREPPLPPPTSTPPVCDTSFNSYNYTPAALATCGIRTFPLSSVTTTADGIRIFSYDEGNGVVARYPGPPADLNLASATSNQLTELDLGTPPAGVSSLTWLADLSTMTIATPGTFQAEGTSSADTTHSGNWSGYADTTNNDNFNGAEADYQEPSYDNNTCSNDQTAVWAGIGGFSGGPIGQVGTAHNATGLQNHEGWYEVAPLELQQAIPTFVASFGDEIEADVLRESS